MANDDFATALGSMDSSQLRALLAEMQNRSNDEWALADPRVDKPKVSFGAFEDPTKEYGSGPGDWSAVPDIATKSASLSHQYHKYRKRKKDKKKAKEYARAMQAERGRQRSVLAERLKAVENQIRTVDLRDKVNTQFRDLGLEGLNKRVVDAGLQNNLLGISQQHEDLTRQGGFGAAATGLSGSSVDAERLSDTAASEQAARSQAVSQAQMQFNQLNQQSDDARRQLLNSVSGSNPGEEARLGGEISNIGNQATQFGLQAQGQANNFNWQNQNMANQSQALGGLLSTYGALYTQNQQRQGY